MTGYIKSIFIVMIGLVTMELSLAQESIPEQIKQYLHLVHQEGFGNCSLDVEGAIARQGVRTLNPMLKEFYADPPVLPVFLESFSDKMLDMRASNIEKAQYAFRLMGAPAGGVGPPLAGTRSGVQPCRSEKELAGWLDVLVEKKVVLENIKENIAWERTAFRVRNLVIYLIRAMESTDHLFREYISTVVPGSDKIFIDEKETMDWLLKPILQKELSECSSVNAYEHADLRKLSYASRKLMEHINTALQMIRECRDDDISEGFSFKSKYGMVALLGTGNDTLSGPYALIIDLGGDDVYRGGIACSGAIPGRSGILIDKGGNDTYLSANDMSVCQATMGAAILVDMAGNDSYESTMSGLSSSFFGFSYLYDCDGDDRYLSKSFYSLGSAICGIAILDDLNGNDRYSSGSYSQGYAGPGGVGILVDAGGDDQYGSPKNEIISFVQGASKGRWAEATDGHSLSGGCGFLIDGGGDDHYHAASFAQGAAYYFGAGFLVDIGGDDAYSATSHSQAYGVHYSLSCLIELNGNDLYNTQSDTSQVTQLIASGRDHSAGILLEIEGNDEYCFGNRSVGISDMEGVGIFLDMEGSDLFRHRRNEIYSGSGSMGKTFKSGRMMKRFSISTMRTKPVSIYMDVEPNE